jgi:hypothetical protein
MSSWLLWTFLQDSWSKNSCQCAECVLIWAAAGWWAALKCDRGVTEGFYVQVPCLFVAVEAFCCSASPVGAESAAAFQWDAARRPLQPSDDIIRMPVVY